MKFRGLVSMMIAAFLLAGSAAICTKGASAAPVKGVKPPAVLKAASQDDWDALVKEAQKEGKVVIYGAPMGEAANQLKKAFRDRYRIDMEFVVGRGGSSEVAEKLLTERRAGLYLADVINGGLTTFFNIIVPAKLALPLEPLLVLDEVKDRAKWRSGKIPFLDRNKSVVAPCALASHYIAINGDLVKDTEITSFTDLLEPKWKGKIIVNDPTVIGRGNNWFTYMLFQAMSKEKGEDFMKKLLANQPAVLRDERLQVEWLAKGKYPVLIGGKRTTVESFIKAGASVKWVRKTGAALLSSGPFYLNEVQKSAHPHALKVFFNWILGKEAGEIIAKYGGFPSERLDVSTAGFDPSQVPGPADVAEDEDYVLRSSNTLSIAGKIFKGIVQ